MRLTQILSSARWIPAVSFGVAAVAAAAVSGACSSPANSSPVAPSVATASAAAKPGGGGGGHSGPIAATTTLADSLNGFQLRVRSDGGGAYTNTSPTQSIVDFGQGNNWMMTTYTLGRRGTTAGPRTVYFDLSEPVSAGNPPPPIQPGPQQAHLVTKCDMLAIALNTTAPCTGDFRFDPTSTTAYRLSFAPNNYPEVNPFNVTCRAADSLGCSQWTLATSGTTSTGADPNPKGVQRLVQIDPLTEAILNSNLGDYYISFSISISR